MVLGGTAGVLGGGSRGVLHGALALLRALCRRVAGNLSPSTADFR